MVTKYETSTNGALAITASTLKREGNAEVDFLREAISPQNKCREGLLARVLCIG